MDIKEKIKELIIVSLKDLDIKAENIILEHPADLTHGDYSTNIAFVAMRHLAVALDSHTGEIHLARKDIGIPKTPKDLAEQLKSELHKKLPKEISRIEVAGPGFINFYLSREFFTNSIKEILKAGENWGKNNLSDGKKVMVEYTDPNPFKPFHIGHLMTNAIGESIARIFEFSGAGVIRANYQGDVGPHVAKAIYGIMWLVPSEESNPKIATIKPVAELAYWIGECYTKGATAYEEDPSAKIQIDEINKKIYDKSDVEINKIYHWGREVTLEAFEEIYKILGTHFNHYFFESVMAPIGEKIVRENVGSVFSESDGAIVFHGENYDSKLHTRVFINSKGLPTYETKEIGLTVTKFNKENEQENPLDTSIVVTAIEQGEYMKVVSKAISLIHPDYENRMKHITHGMMKFSSGKMSSRKGNVVTGESLIHDSMDLVHEKVAERDLTEAQKKSIARIVGVGAIKYSILKSSLGSDIIYDFEKSISFDGDSGPYLQYTAVRASSIIKKAKSEDISVSYENVPEEVTELEHLLYQFKEVVAHSYEMLEPHHIATYLTELASAFNTFYGETAIVDKSNPSSSYRVALVQAFYQTMKNGLYLLGIETPEKM